MPYNYSISAIVFITTLLVLPLAPFFLDFYSFLKAKYKSYKNTQIIKNSSGKHDLFFLNSIKRKVNFERIPKDIKQFLISKIGEECLQEKSHYGDDIMVFSLENRGDKNKYPIRAQSVDLVFYYSFFEENKNIQFLDIVLRENFGKPKWNGEKVVCDYPVFCRQYYTNIPDFDDTWDTIIKCICGDDEHDKKTHMF